MPKEDTGRVESFSDGVFAVAITLLVLDLKVPQQRDVTANTHLWSMLAHQWPSFLAFVISFITILIMWINHHMVMKLVQLNDGNFMLINGLLLMFITIIPFTTALLSAHIGHEGARAAIIIYNGTLFAVAGMFQGFWRYAVKNERLLSSGYDRLDVKRINIQFGIGLIMYAITFILSFILTKVSLCLCVLLTFYFLAVGLFKKRH